MKTTTKERTELANEFCEDSMNYFRAQEFNTPEVLGILISIIVTELKHDGCNKEESSKILRIIIEACLNFWEDF